MLHLQLSLRLRTHKTLYEIWKGKKPNLKHLHEFDSLRYIFNDKEPRGKFDAKSDEGVFLCYCSNSHAYRVYNKRTMVVIESINVRVDDYLLPIDSSKEEHPHIGSLYEKGNILNIPKDAPSSIDGGKGTFSTDVQIIQEGEHPFIEDIRNR